MQAIDHIYQTLYPSSPSARSTLRLLLSKLTAPSMEGRFAISYRQSPGRQHTAADVRPRGDEGGQTIGPAYVGPVDDEVCTRRVGVISMHLESRHPRPSQIVQMLCALRESSRFHVRRSWRHASKLSLTPASFLRGHSESARCLSVLIGNTSCVRFKSPPCRPLTPISLSSIRSRSKWKTQCRLLVWLRPF